MAKLITVEKFDEGKKISFGSIEHTITAEENDAKKVTVAGVGSFDWNSGIDKVAFAADAALAGEISLTATDATITAADFSKAAGGVKFTGEDGQTVTFGTGADTLVQTNGQVAVAGYNYYEGDVIEASGDVALSDNGKLTIAIDSVTASKVAVKDNWYAAKVGVVDYFTAVGGNNVNVTKDLSKSTVDNKVDAGGAKTANITLGKANDAVSLATVGEGVDTIKVGKASGNNTVENFGKEDVVAIDGIKLVTLGLNTVGSGDNVKASYGSTGLTFNGMASAQGSFNLNDGSQTHKLAYDLAGNGTLDYNTYSDADWVLGAAGTTLEVGATTHLHDMSKYRDITNISVSTDAKLDAPISLTGAINKDNKIDAANAKVVTAIWGFSSGSDSITLGSGQDTVWFGAGDGTDSITNFKYGTASDSDVLYLKDTKTLKDIDAANTKFTVGKAVASVNANTTGNDVAQIQLADEKTYKVAGEYNTANTVTINTDDIDGLDYYAFAGDGNAKAVNITGSKNWIFHSLYTDFYTTGANVATINASGATGNVTLAAAASIQGGAGTNNIWTYQANKAATVAAGTGTDIIWFAENADQAVNVSGFAAGTDVVKFATAQSLKDIYEGYTFDADISNTTIKGAKNSASALNLDGVHETIDLVDANDKAYKASLAKSGTALSFSTDVNIYGGGATILSADGSVDGTVSLRLGKESRGLSSDTYYIDDKVTEFDGSKSTAIFWIAGNANESNTITGGMTENYLYGGGAESDNLVGSIVAKDTFYFGTGDGVDRVTDGIDKEDIIALWNVEDSDIANVKVTVDPAGTGKVTVSLSDTSTLTLSNITGGTAEAALTDGLTFTSASQTAYTYDSESKTLVKKA